MAAQEETLRAEESPDPLARVSLIVTAMFSLLLAALQVVVFGPALDGNVVPLPPPFSQAYRVDALSLFFGTTICLAGCFASAASAASAAGSTPKSGSRQGMRAGLALCLMCVALTSVAYSQGLLPLTISWEVAGLALWIGKRPARWLAAAVHAPGLILLAILGVGVPDFVPPTGGVVRAWPAAITAAFAIVALARCGCWPFSGWLRLAAESGGIKTTMFGLYALSASYLLAKALVAAPWSPAGTWLMLLLGTVGLVGAATSVLGSHGPARVAGIASAYSAGSIVGFALAPGAPMAALGAVAFMFSGLLLVSVQANIRQPLSFVVGWVGLTGGALGAWCVAAGAIELNYGIVAAVLLPLGVLLALCVPLQSRFVRAGVVVAAFSVIIGIFPQGAVGWVLRPVVDSLAGGVAAPGQVSIQWLLGIESNAGEALQAAFPATGIALAVFLALITLRWISRLLQVLVPPEEPAVSVEMPALSMDDILPGSEQVGRMLDPSGWPLRAGRTGKVGPPPP